MIIPLLSDHLFYVTILQCILGRSHKTYWLCLPVIPESHLYLQLILGGLVSSLRYLCFFAYSGVQHILCLVYPMLPVSLWIVHFIYCPKVFTYLLSQGTYLHRMSVIFHPHKINLIRNNMLKENLGILFLLICGQKLRLTTGFINWTRDRIHTQRLGIRYIFHAGEHKHPEMKINYLCRKHQIRTSINAKDKNMCLVIGNDVLFVRKQHL